MKYKYLFCCSIKHPSLRNNLNSKLLKILPNWLLLFITHSYQKENFVCCVSQCSYHCMIVSVVCWIYWSYWFHSFYTMVRLFRHGSCDTSLLWMENKYQRQRITLSKDMSDHAYCLHMYSCVIIWTLNLQQILLAET